jgi:hypothetical protein
MLERASTVEDALKVNQALSDVQKELERLQRRSELLQRSARYASVTVTFLPDSAGAWRPLELARQSAAVLVQLLQLVGSALIVCAVFAPVWAPVVVALLVRRGRARRRALR